MDKCKHIGRLRLAQDHSILNPQKWHCVDCNTTESVWACLSCSHVACGRYIEEHALKHFQESGHPVALEVNELYVFCYLCDDYVLNDNATGDLKLLRIMWSGKWALVSPFAMLHSVWRLIPAFRGYAQQDAQEFLCELLDKVQQELETTGTKYPALIPASQRKLIKQVLNVVNNIFHGQLLSQVTCLACDNKSNTVEPFWDLSLEFPERYHCNGKEMSSQYPCLLTEMLAKFTQTEALEGKIYACDQCNKAQKQLMVCRLPQVLRLHLKRFRWSGRNHREKIGVHVHFDQMLNMEPYCCRESLKSLLPDCFIYDLSAVVMHHGKGFGSGHYTAYCYNSEGGFWVHCNDSKLNMCTMEEVCKAQAYILFYSQRLTQANGPSKIPCPSTADSQQHTELADCSMDNSSS
ncbi:hypothetical protein AV530_013940 [Patagioenas fasciata monilis]|uniref:ubiquitinyl hydrolase 1 n=1 Tax=Patagioenas fasciata monilis TaxID=372326 RepID=A0A1V4KN46_PATFA|nr:hypothetical protein AV530_013940 [Patagioenas fasciata monilis]